MSFYISLGVTFEIFFIIIALFSEIRKYIYSLAEAYVYSAVLTLSILSVSIHFFFLFRIHEFYPAFEGFLISISVYLSFRNRHILIESWASFKNFCTNSPIYFFTLAFFAFCLLTKGFLLPPTTYDSITYHLPRIMMMQSEGKFFLENFSDYRQDIMTIGYDILYFLYLRFFTDYGLATFGFVSYTIILSGIFALVTKFFSDLQLSKIICFISASLTMFAVHAWSTKNDLIFAAIAITCFLSAYNLLKEKSYIHLFILLVALTFGFNVKFTFGAFALPFIFFFGILLFKQFGLESFAAIIDKHNFKYIFSLILPVSTILIICIVLFHNYSEYGAVMGPHFYYYSFSGKDGWAGSLLNLIRYFFQAIDLPPELGGIIFTKLHDLALGGLKSTGVILPEHFPASLTGSFNPSDIKAWYGLMGMPILLAIIFTMFQGREFLRFIALSISIYAIIVGIKVPWFPWCGRYFALTFAGGMICFAFMLKWIAKRSLRVSRYIIGLALLVSIMNLTYLAFYSNFFQFEQLKHHFKDRDLFYSKYYSTEGWKVFIEKIQPGSKVLVVAGTDAPIFQLLLRRPDLDITVTGVPNTKYSGLIYTGDLYRERLKLNGKKYDLSERRDFKTIQKLYDVMLLIKVPQKLRDYYNS